MKKKRLIIAVVIICCVILYIWQTNKIHNTPKKDTAVSTKSNATTQQAETTTQVTAQTSTETTMESDTEVYGTEGGNNTFDKIFLLSLSEVSEQQDGEKYGFLDDEIRACGKSDFSKTGSWWWLRSPGYASDSAAVVSSRGWVARSGRDVYYFYDGVRPTLHLNLSSPHLFSYAGTVSSDGTKNEVPYNTRTRLVQN